MEQNIHRYRDHVIEVRPHIEADRAVPKVSAERAAPVAAARSAELLIDGEPVGYDRLFDGTLYLPAHAYEWDDDLVELAKKLIDYRDQVSEARRRGTPEA